MSRFGNTVATRINTLFYTKILLLILTCLASWQTAQAAPMSPIVPAWKWGRVYASNPNDTYVYDNYNQIKGVYMAQLLGYYPGSYPKYAPRQDIPRDQLGADYPYQRYCCNCSLYSWHQEFGNGTAAVELTPSIEHGCEYFTSAIALFSHSPICPIGYRLSWSNSQPYPLRFTCGLISNATELEEKEPKDCPEEGLIGNPINLALQAKYQTETDYRSGAASKLQFKRSYISKGLSRQIPAIGQNWWHNYSRHISLSVGFSFSTAFVFRPNGRTLSFNSKGANWVTDADISDRLIRLTDSQGVDIGWQYFDARSNETEEYDIEGKLTKITALGGQTQTLIYSDDNTDATIAPFAGLLIEVHGHFDRKLQLRYSDTGQISSMIDPAGQTHSYTYDALQRLISASHPDNSSRLYHYEDPNCKKGLTGITDERGIRLGTYSYDSTCRIISSENAGGVNRYSVNYTNSSRATVLDPLNTAREYNYTTILGVKKNIGVSQPCPSCGGNAAQARQYDSRGNTIEKTDFNNNKTIYSYNDRNLEISRTEANGNSAVRVILTDWHPSFSLPTTITRLGHKQTLSYDNNGNLISKTDIDTSVNPLVERTTQYQYNSDGRLISVDGPRNDVSDITQYDYDAQGNLIKITNALGQTTHLTNYDAHGNPHTLIDPNDVKTQLNYDNRQRLLSRTIAADTAAAATTAFTYDTAGNLTKLTPANGAYLQYQYDNAQRLIGIHDNQGNRIEYTLDNMGNRLQENIYDNSQTLKRRHTSEFDTLNRMIKLIGANNQTTQFNYDNNGNQTSTTNPRNNTSTHAFDALNRLIEDTNPLNGKTHYQYDSRDNLTRVIDPKGLTTQYTYNGFNETTRQTSPDSGQTLYAYDAAGNRILETDARGISRNYSYDALNRLTHTQTPASNETISYQYDQGTYGIGKLSSISDLTGQLDFEYDARGNLIKAITNIGTQRYTISYAYNNTNQLSDIAYPSGRTLHYSYDPLGRINEISTHYAGTTKILASGLDYLPFGPQKQLTYGNALTQTDQYDLDYRLSTRQIPGIQNLSWQYDANNNISALNNLQNPAKHQQFSYDALDRLQSAQGQYGLIEYSYDAIGNRLSQTQNNQTDAYLYNNPANHRLSDINGLNPEHFNYDAAGNTLSNAQLNFSYDNHNRLKQISDNNATPQANYQHNALGQRIRKTLPHSETLFHYDPFGQLIAETTAEGQPIREYVYLNNRPLALISYLHEASGESIRSNYTVETGKLNLYKNNEWIDDKTLSNDTWENGRLVVDERGAAMTERLHYYHVDHLNTPQWLTDENQTLAWSALYQPFGQVTLETNLIEQPLRFSGQYFDQETDLHYNYFRYYDPATGRYITSDPIGLAGGINTYAYVENNPIINIDPKGLQSEALLPSCAFGGPYNPVCDVAVIVTACKWMLVVGGAIVMTQDTGDCDDGNCPDESSRDETKDEAKDETPPPDRKNCEALKQSILNTCYGLVGRKRMACFEAANTAYRQCMGFE